MARRQRAERGSVQVCKHGGSLRLLLTHQGERYTVGLGLKASSPWHRHLAGERALWIETELKYGRFNPEKMEHYRTILHGEQATLNASPETKTVLLGELWEQYSLVRSVGKSPATQRYYTWVRGSINRLPTQDLQQPQLILDAIAQLTPDVQKRLLIQFNACVKYAQKLRVITDNPFLGLAVEVEIPKGGTTDDEVYPFSTAERDQIIGAFKDSHYYQHYANLVTFMFFTGARPCEVTPLQWKQVKPKYVLFEQSRVYTGRGYQTKEGLKTQRFRHFPINEQLGVILSSIERGKPEMLVFPSPTGKHVNWSNFTRRAWDTVLAGLTDIEPRNPYQMRHSFISHCKEAGIPSLVVSEWVGNSPRTLDKVYSKVTKQHQVPTL